VKLKVEKTYHEDLGPVGPDGQRMFSYRYFLFVFSFDRGERLVARSYVDAPSEAHFFRLEGSTPGRRIVESDFSRSLFIEAAAYLRNSGHDSLTWLSFEAEGYIPVPGRE
jgi:hypothetical protein